MRNKQTPSYFAKVFTTYMTENQRYPDIDTNGFGKRMTPAKRKRINRLAKYALRSTIG